MPQTMRLLIAEDEDNIRQHMEDHIRKNAKQIDEVYGASNGQEALDLMVRYRPQIMLLDIQMPLKDGIAVLREATAAGICPKTLILSGHDDFSYAQQAIRYKVVDYLLKPCRASEMLARVEEMARQLRSEEGGDPAEELPAEAAQQGNALVAEAMEYIERHYHKDLTLGGVAEVIGITPGYLSSLFKRTLSSGFVECLNKVRIDRACSYFVDPRIRTYEVAYKVGFHDEKYFSSVFKKVMGVTPSEYRKNLTGDKP